MGLWQGAPGAAVSHPVGGRGLALPAGEDGHHRLHQAPGGGREAEEQGEQPSHHHQMPPDFGDTGADLLGEKITKFTDSCISLLRGRVCSEARGRRLGSGEQRRGRAPEAGGHQSSHPRLALWPRRLVSSCRSWAALGAVVV